MQLFLKKDEYFSINGYADAILDYAAHHETENALIHKYATEDDRLNGINAIGGFVPYKPYSREQICEGIRLLKSIQFVKCDCLTPKALIYAGFRECRYEYSYQIKTSRLIQTHSKVASRNPLEVGGFCYL